MVLIWIILSGWKNVESPQPFDPSNQFRFSKVHIRIPIEMGKVSLDFGDGSMYVFGK